MSDIYVENYKKSVTIIFNRWNKELSEIAKQLQPIDDEIAKLAKNTHQTDDDKKHLTDLKKKRDDLRKKIDTANLNLKVNLILIEVDPKANHDEALKIPDFLKAIIKEKGVPITDDVTIVPDIAIDFKKGKLTKFGLTLQWKF